MNRQEDDTNAGLHPGMAHAMRTPLGALVSALDVAGLPGVDDATREEALAIARRQAQRLAVLIDRFDQGEGLPHG